MLRAAAPLHNSLPLAQRLQLLGCICQAGIKALQGRHSLHLLVLLQPAHKLPLSQLRYGVTATSLPKTCSFFTASTSRAYVPERLGVQQLGHSTSKTRST